MSKYKRISAPLLMVTLATALTLTCLPASAANFPVGTYAAQDFTLSFDGKGHFRASEKGAIDAEGDYVVTGDRVQFTDTSGAGACTKPGQQSGTYRWKADAKTLTFFKLNDPCKERAGALAPQPWQRQG